MIFFLHLLLPCMALADSPLSKAAQDPLCENKIDLKAILNQTRPLHLKYPQLKGAVKEQDTWFNGVSAGVKTLCEGDTRFAQELLKLDRSQLNGQCGPAEEAAAHDKMVLEQAEKSLETLNRLYEKFVRPSKKGSQEPLRITYERNRKALETYAYDLRQVDLKAACEMKWLYPDSYLASTTRIEGCTPPAWMEKLGKEDRADPGVFAVLIVQLNHSKSYRKERLSLAAATAKESMGRFEACIAQIPGYQPKILQGKSGTGSGKAQDQKPAGSKSDITGTKEDEQKRNQSQ